MGMVFSATECVVEKARAKHDMTNTAVAGCVTGGSMSAKALKKKSLRNLFDICWFCQLSHSYSIPLFKRICARFLEQSWLTKENVIDVLQLARKCESPQLSICIRMIGKDLKSISSTEGWKVMKRANPALKQELVEYIVEADSLVDLGLISFGIAFLDEKVSQMVTLPGHLLG